MPGRPPKPTGLHVLQGTLRTTRHSGRTSEPNSGPIGRPPSWLNKVGKAEWRRLVNHKTIGKLLQESDRGALEHYCLLYSRFVADAKGPGVEGFRIMSASERQMYHSLCMQLGMTPAARAKVQMPAESVETSKWDKVANQ